MPISILSCLVCAPGSPTSLPLRLELRQIIYFSSLVWPRHQQERRMITKRLSGTISWFKWNDIVFENLMKM